MTSLVDYHDRKHMQFEFNYILDKIAEEKRSIAGYYRHDAFINRQMTLEDAQYTPYGYRLMGNEISGGPPKQGLYTKLDELILKYVDKYYKD